MIPGAFASGITMFGSLWWRLLTYYDNAAVAIVLSKGLNSVTIRVDCHTVGSNTFLLQGLSHLLSTLLSILGVDGSVTSTLVSIARKRLIIASASDLILKRPSDRFTFPITLLST
jgi:hypothetical protein